MEYFQGNTHVFSLPNNRDRVVIIGVGFLDELGKFLSLALFTPHYLDNSVQVWKLACLLAFFRSQTRSWFVKPCKKPLARIPGTTLSSWGKVGGAAAGGEREGEGEIGEAHAQEPPEETNYLWAHCDIFQIKNLLFPDKIMLISKKTFERKKKNTAINQFGFAHFTFFLSCHHTPPHPIKFWMK